MRKHLQNIAGWLLVILTFLLPLKFGSLAMMPEQAPMFPSDLLTLIIISWPPHAAGIFGSLLLLLTLAVYPAPSWKSSGKWGYLLFFFGVPLAVLPGFIGASVMDYPLGSLSHWSGVCCCGLSAWWICSSAPEWKKMMIGALTFSVLIVGMDAWRQYFWGFEEMHEMLKEQSGGKVNRVVELRMLDRRIFATLGSCNTLAGFLLLTTPLTLSTLWNWGGRFEPVKISRVLFMGAGLFLTAGPLLLTRSRGAWLCALCVAGLWFISRRGIKTKWKIAAAAAGCAAVLTGAVIMQSTIRGMLSVSERFDYLRSGIIMCGQNPLCGAGWGEFFHFHMSNKKSGSNESARDPHNLVLSFACQSGIPAGIICGAGAGLLLLFLFRSRERSAVCRVGKWGLLAFALHSLMEINGSIPCSMALFGILASAIPEKEPGDPGKNPAVYKILLPAASLLLCVTAFVFSLQWLRGDSAYEKLEMMLRPANVRNALPPSPYAVMKQLEAVEKVRPGSPYPAEMVGDWLLHIKDIDNAERIYRKVVLYDPKRPGIYRRLAMIAYLRGDIAGCRSLLAKARSLFPADERYTEKRFFQEMTKKR